MTTMRKGRGTKPPGLRQVRFAAGIKDPQSAIVLLKADHREVEGFFKATGAQAIHDEALVEHDGAKKLSAEIESGGASDPLFDAKITVLSEMIKHHVREEERFGGMFSKARMAKIHARRQP